nr:MAG TPA: CRISPR-associated protein [Caudoviricetes sp.]
MARRSFYNFFWRNHNEMPLCCTPACYDTDGF